MYRIYKKQGNKILGSLDVNEKGLIQALTTAYPMDAQKAITAKHNYSPFAWIYMFLFCYYLRCDSINCII